MPSGFGNVLEGQVFDLKKRSCNCVGPGREDAQGQMLRVTGSVPSLTTIWISSRACSRRAGTPQRQTLANGLDWLLFGSVFLVASSRSSCTLPRSNAMSMRSACT